MKKKKTGLDYVKQYNRKIMKTKKPYVYVEIDESMYQNLTPSERGQITKQLKKFDLRKERKVSGSDVSINTRNLLKLLEKFSNKRIEEYTKATTVNTYYSAGQEVPMENQYIDNPILTTNIDVKKLSPEEIKRKAKSFQRHFNPDFYDKQMQRMKDNYVMAILDQTIDISGHDREGIVKFIKEMDNYEFYRIYKSNLDMRVIFENSPKTKRKAEIEFPMTDPKDTLDAIAVASGYAKQVLNDLVSDLSKDKQYKKSQIKKLKNMDLTEFWTLYVEDAIDIYIENL